MNLCPICDLRPQVLRESTAESEPNRDPRRQHLVTCPLHYPPRSLYPSSSSFSRAMLHKTKRRGRALKLWVWGLGVVGVWRWKVVVEALTRLLNLQTWKDYHWHLWRALLVHHQLSYLRRPSLLSLPSLPRHLRPHRRRRTETGSKTHHSSSRWRSSSLEESLEGRWDLS